MEAVSACRVCLALDSRLRALTDTSLQQHYEHLTGLKVEWGDGRPQYVCYECAARLHVHHNFRDKCLRAEQLLAEIVRTRGQITEESLKQIDRAKHRLSSTITYGEQNKYVFLQHCDAVVKQENEIAQPGLNEEFDVKDENLLHTPDASDDDTPLYEISKKETRLKAVRVRVKKEKKMLIKKKTRPSNGELKPMIKTAKKRGPFNEEFATEMLLSKEQQLDELKQRATTLNYLNSPYKCTKCYKGFVDDTAYKNHLTKHDPVSGEYFCEICQMRYTSERRLRAHTISSHSRKYACKTCTYVAHTANQAREHDKWHKGYLYECHLCGQKFKKPTSHLTHMRKQHPTEFVCTVCGDSFIGRHGLMMHKQKTHKVSHVEGKVEAPSAPAPERYCRECNVEFETAEACKRHTVTSARHALNNEFGTGCRVCGEKFNSREQLAAHSKQHVKRAPRAGDAADARAPGDQLQPDFSITHVQCNQCSAKFVNRSKCLAHERRVHLGLKYNKNIVCELCGKKCTSNATLKYHQRTHTGERPYSCSDCPKRFSDRNQLRIHIRTHTDERPYSCSYCQKTFRQKPALNRHFRIHTGAKPYECQYCMKTFSQSNSLKIHVHTVHLKLPAAFRGRNKTAPPPPPPLQQDKSHSITLQIL